MAKIKFKSSGTQISEVTALNKERVIQEKVFNIGIITPMRLGKDEIFSMHIDLEEQLKDNYKNLLLTNFGERLGTYDYGANLRPLLSEQYNSGEEFEEIIAQRVVDATVKWMPFINVLNIGTKINENLNFGRGLSSVTIDVLYNIPNINNVEKTLKINLFIF
jgi:phage baseplate assembly protein W